MKSILNLCLPAFMLAVISCGKPEPGLVVSDLSEMVGHDVLVTTTVPVAVSVVKGTGQPRDQFETGIHLECQLKNVDPAGVTIVINKQTLWIAREFIVAIVDTD